MSLLRFNRAKWWSCTGSGQTQAQTQTGQRTRSSSVKKDWGVLGDKRMDMSWQCQLTARSHILLCIKIILLAAGQGRWFCLSTLLSWEGALVHPTNPCLPRLQTGVLCRTVTSVPLVQADVALLSCTISVTQHRRPTNLSGIICLYWGHVGYHQSLLYFPCARLMEGGSGETLQHLPVTKREPTRKLEGDLLQGYIETRQS